MTREQAESQRGGWDAPLILIQTGGNLGFAGGNNVGLRLALHDPDCQFFWLLNNDSVVAPAALSAMVRVMQQRPEVGLCGSLNLFYHSPDKVQAQGGFHYRRWRRWTARVRLGPPMNVAELPAVPPPMDYVHGASMLTSRSFLKTVGLMEESYFLYFEELDWALRARGRFELGYAPESLVFHKEGASIGSHRDRSKRSLISDQYLSRSRVLLSKRFFPWSLPSVILSTSLAAGYWFCRGDRERASIMLASILQALRMHRPIIGSNADPGSAFHS
jgi:GT2 family glycosyltransferase